MAVLIGIACCAHAPKIGVSRSAALDDRYVTGTPTEGTRPLGPLRGARLKVARGALRAASELFPFSTQSDACVLLFDATSEWLIGCEAQTGHDGFIATGERLFDQRVLWHADPVTLGAQKSPYAVVGKRLVGTVAKIAGARADDPGRPVFVMQDYEALLAGHPGFQQTSGSEEWLAIFVHEAFHAKQFWHPVMRPWMQRIGSQGMNDGDLEGFYRATPAFAEAVNAEHAALRDAFEKGAPTAADARAALERWRTQRRARIARFAPAWKADAKVSLEALEGLYLFVEGTARYVEARFAMDPPQAVAALAGTDEKFHGFTATKRHGPGQLPGLSGVNARYFYSMGMYVSFLLDALQPDWKAHVLDDEGLLLTAVDRALARK